MTTRQNNALLNSLCSLAFMAATSQASAHLIFDPNSSTPPRNLIGSDCGTRGNTPAVFKSGANITVQYKVLIKHGDNIQIDFSAANDTNFTVLKNNITAAEGSGSASITFPNIECSSCTLRIINSGYTSCADITLTKTGVINTNPNDTTAPAAVTDLQATPSNKSIVLQWQNPSADFEQVIVLQADANSMATPIHGTPYTMGDTLEDAKVIYAGTNNYTAATQLATNTAYSFRLFTRDASLNYSPASAITATTLNMSNSAPSTVLNVMQNGTLTTQINPTLGPVMVQAVVTDEDTEDTHTLDWSATDNRLIDTNNDAAILEFDPQYLSDGNYTVMLSATDTGTPAKTSTASATLIVKSAATTPTTIPTVTASNTPNKSSGGGFYAYGLLLLLLLPLRKNVSP